VHAAQRPADGRASPLPGIEVERRFLPVRSIGIYAPGGRASYPSSLVMAAVPAQVAGAERIAVVSPRPTAALLATVRELGLDEVYAVGGAQAIGALAYGTETVPAVDKIVGPGNRWVTAAKLLVSGRVGIDLPAGPSEVLIVADETADPALCAADLLAQAEHGPDSECVLVTTSARLAEAVGELVAGEQVRVELVATLDEALARADAYAPEHLELLVADAEGAAARVVNAGSVFLGHSAPAVVGDYAAGANHVLPTGGLARAAGGLGLEAFLKPVQYVRATEEGLAAVRETVSAFARVEGLPLHAAAVEARFAAVPG
jgi:histidinol dehydrogenase